MDEIREYDSSRFYVFSRSVVSAAVRLLYQFRVVGREHIPVSGPVVICSNHIHNFDPPVLGLATKRFLYFMAKEELFQRQPFSWLLSRLGGFPIRRGGQDKRAIRRAVEISKGNGCLVIFPEGHRSKDGSLGKGMTGAAFIARKAECPIVPTAIVGTYHLRKPLVVRFGEPMLPLPDDTNDSLIARIMENIGKLVEEEKKSL